MRRKQSKTRWWKLKVVDGHENQGIGSPGALLRETRRVLRQSNNVCVDPYIRRGEWNLVSSKFYKKSFMSKFCSQIAGFSNEIKTTKRAQRKTEWPKIGWFSWQSPEEPHKIKVNKNQTSIQSGSLLGLLHGFCTVLSKNGPPQNIDAWSSFSPVWR